MQILKQEYTTAGKHPYLSPDNVPAVSREMCRTVAIVGLLVRKLNVGAVLGNGVQKVEGDMHAKARCPYNVQHVRLQASTF